MAQTGHVRNSTTTVNDLLCIVLGSRVIRSTRPGFRPAGNPRLLFPSYVFVEIIAGWWHARWSAGVICLIQNGSEPTHVPDRIITDLRSRERNGLIQLPRSPACNAATRSESRPDHSPIGWRFTTA